MRVPLAWLHEHCHPDLDTAALAHRLTMTGTKEDRTLHHGVRDPDGFVVGRVESVTRHPDADRLSVCEVDLGEQRAQIVCGAPNVAAGLTVAVARPGATMLDGTRLKSATLRGVSSEGMILAEDELGLGTDHSGILVLDDGTPPGTPLQQVLPIVTDVLELEITPNRPDCLGIYGVAREVHAATGAPLGPAPWEGDAGSDEPEIAGVSVQVSAPELCPRFTARVFDQVRIGPSPTWLKARLMAAGQRPISNVVDITNYVMLLTGQPLHAFDLDRVAGGHLVVRRAAEGERLQTLDGTERPLDPEMVVIADADGPSSLAGVMGGTRSEVDEATTRVLLEAATWVGDNIQRTSTRLGLRSEASARFEKGLSPEATIEAQAVATALLVSVCGARPVPGSIDVGGPGPEPTPILLRVARVAALLGAGVPGPRCMEILRALGFGVSEAGAGELWVTVPHFRRRDVTREADLIEEIARIDGVENLPATLPARRGVVGRLTRAQRLRRRAEDALVGCGLHEIQGWSFTSADVVDRLGLEAGHPWRRMVRLENPMSEEAALLRPTLLTSLLDAAAHNVSRGAQELALFEHGAVYGPDPDGRRGWPATEVERIGVVLNNDFFAAKGVLEALAVSLGVSSLRVRRGRREFLHPGRAADVDVDGTSVGWIGELHPRVAQAWQLPGAAGFELDLEPLLGAVPALVAYEDLISFPELRQDLAVVLDEGVPAADLVDTVRVAAGPLLDRVEIFDVYEGEQVGPGQRSIALALAFRAPDRTLTDEDVLAVRERVTAAIAQQLGGMLRA
ncbi:MAG TPA: phenylalanine--tRNA ligase subunit beta [Solirubrobacteraceae bacterium]|nr:phenylalanine--tRNA ligase subunit beta [Solirubrobacteraceae bacterium]